MPSRAAFARRIAVVLAALLALAALLFAADRWATLRAEGITDADARAAARSHAGLLTSELQKFRLLPLVLVEYPDVGAALAGDAVAARRLDATFELLAARTDAANLYAIDAAGRTVAASNWRLPTSFVGQNYGFRPYFRGAMRSGAAELFALGTISGRPGLYLARRVERAGRFVGVVVVKVEFDTLESAWARIGGISVVVDRHGVILITSRPAWRFRSIGPVSPAVLADARRTLQFGDAAPQPAPIAIDGPSARVNGADRFRAAEVEAPIAGARLIHLAPLDAALAASRGVVLIWGLGLLLLAAVAIGLAVRSAEKRRLQREARTRLEREVAARTADLREANAQLTVESQERAEADRRYRAAREELAQANRLGTLGQITAGVAHEINQPVAAIRTFADSGARLIERGGVDAARENLDRIVGLADRIGAITAELRGFARKRTPAGAGATLGSVLDGVMMLVGERTRGVLDIGISPQLRALQLAGDRVRIEQILVNLIQNALDAIADSPAGRISVDAVRSGEVVTLTVADTGPGVPLAIADQLFTPFTSSKPEGLGLGLAIARDIAREFGGDLVHHPAPVGARFDLTLRVAS
ncbi:sensor histidine kinase [Sphingomonas sp.]|uniref:sensor histidine kinase n=1 Tax=Sphingomonas sp. TaxID=28214 RepID=UPI002DD685B9|nr:ATP-binding protein [Sphingomonas sp.]